MIKRHDQPGIFKYIRAYKGDHHAKEIRPEKGEILYKNYIPECRVETETSSLKNKPERKSKCHRCQGGDITTVKHALSSPLKLFFIVKVLLDLFNSNIS